MSKELIESAQSAQDVDRGIDDSTRLPVVAWWLKNSGGEKDLVGLGSGEHVYQGVYDEKIFLCRITDAQSLATDLRLELNAKRLKLCAALKERNDAQARLAEKDARIAEQQGAAIELARLLNEACEEIRNLKAHIRTDNTETLANALKEIERLKRTIETGLDNELALVGERTELRAQLEQLQAAPAERGVAPAALSRAFITSESVDGNYRVVIKSATLQETQQVHNWLARLNPAPATADSDVREVK